MRNLAQFKYESGRGPSGQIAVMNNKKKIDLLWGAMN